MKHENNFLLYSIASAFLLVATAMHLSVANNSNVLAQVGSVDVSLQTREYSNQTEVKLYPIKKIIYSDISGMVQPLTEVSMSDVRITLFDVSEYPESTMIAMITPNDGGDFSFNKVSEGEYVVTLTTVGDVEVLTPRASLSGFNGSKYGYQVRVSEGNSIQPLVFTLQ